MEGRCGQFEEVLNCRGPLTKANWCGCRLDSSGWWGGDVLRPIKRPSRLNRATTADFISACFGKQSILCSPFQNGGRLQIANGTIK